MHQPAAPNPLPPSAPGRGGRDLRRAWRAETIGILLIALAILVFTVLRYGAHINWSAR